MTIQPKALIFDVFGTLVDWRTSVARAVAFAFRDHDLPVSPAQFADLWRGEYQPAMAPIRRGARPYQPLDTLHFENLERVLARLGLQDHLRAAQKCDLNRAWQHLDPWPEVTDALKALKQNALIAPCSNGSIALMSHLARHAGFQWDAILGAEIAGSYKPDPQVYLKSAEALQCDPGEVVMVAAHNDDLAAAAAQGLQTAFFPRPTEHGPDQTTDLKASQNWTFVARDLGDLADQIQEIWPSKTVQS